MATETFSISEPSTKLRQLQHNGYCVLESIADDVLLNRTRACVKQAIADQDPERFARWRAPGTLIDSNNYPELAGIIGNPIALKALNEMGLTDTKFWKAVIISKPPGGPRLYWHQDCLMWQDPRAYSDFSPMIFLMYYLEDTTVENGCLRLLPGTHRRRHILHDLGEAHTADINSVENPNDPRFLDYPNEHDVPIRAGDLVIGDARMFHATHENRSDQRRTVITIWFHPLFDSLHPSTQSWIHADFHSRHSDWPQTALDEIEPVIPRYTGDVEPMKPNRFPDERLSASGP
ncbi:phytanoyl-CoA dioxygenase family protein [Chloroflexi bacterium TSY]|nr:phytanoyl-CoA dioxygenase family protein [Chloroflexi bacterium TSY]